MQMMAGIGALERAFGGAGRTCIAWLGRASTLTVLALGIASGLASCKKEPTQLPSNAFAERQAAFDELSVAAKGEGDQTLHQLVVSRQEQAKEEGTLTAYIDYYLIRGEAIALLERNILESFDSRSELPRDQVERWVNELSAIDPKNRVVRNYIRRTAPVDPRLVAVAKIAPTSRLANSFNVSLYSSMIESEGRGTYELSDQLSLVRASSRTSQEQLLRLLNADPSQYASCQPPSAPQEPGAASFSTADYVIGKCLYDIFSAHNMGLNLHPSTINSFIDPLPGISIAQEIPSSVGGFLGDLAKAYDVNFLLGFDRVAVFAGRDVPRDLEVEHYVYSVRPRYAPVMSVMTALAAGGYTRLTTGLDLDQNIVWLNANMHDYLNAMQVISAVDAPVAQLRVEMEVLEVEQSLISEIGARVPQTIGFAVADPTFRSYTIPVASGDYNYETVVTGGTTGSASIASLNDYGFENVVRALVQDRDFRLVAREQNHKLEINERPVLIMKSGQSSKLSIGSSLPVVTAGVTSSGAVTESVRMMDLGLNVEIGADILDDRNVNLDVALQVSHLLKQTESLRGTSQPHLATRSLETAFVLEDGQTAMIGGVSSLNNRENDNGLPGLARFSLTAWLGGSTGKTQVKNDLIVLITPEILTPQMDLLHTMRNSRHGQELNQGLSNAVGAGLQNYINHSITRLQQSTSGRR